MTFTHARLDYVPTLEISIYLFRDISHTFTSKKNLMAFVTDVFFTLPFRATKDGLMTSTSVMRLFEQFYLEMVIISSTHNSLPKHLITFLSRDCSNHYMGWQQWVARKCLFPATSAIAWSPPVSLLITWVTQREVVVEVEGCEWSSTDCMVPCWIPVAGSQSRVTIAQKAFPWSSWWLGTRIWLKPVLQLPWPLFTLGIATKELVTRWKSVILLSFDAAA